MKCLMVSMAGVLLVACGEYQPRLVITGSSTMAPLLTEIGERYQEHSGVAVDVQTGGSGRGIQDTRQQLADFGMVSRALARDEQDLHFLTIADDGIVLIVHGDNPVAALSDQQVRQIFRGDIRRWQALGGEDRPITVVHKADGRSTQTLFLDYFDLSNSQVRASMIIGDNQQGIQAVASDRNAIGYVSIGTALYEQQQGNRLRLLPLSGEAPSLTALAQGRYPLGRALNLVWSGPLGEQAQDFVDYLSSDVVKDLYADYSFIPRR